MPMFGVTAEVGDYDPVDHPPGYVSEFKMLPNQTAAQEEAIHEQHKTLAYVLQHNVLCCLLFSRTYCRNVCSVVFYRSEKVFNLEGAVKVMLFSVYLSVCTSFQVL